MGLQRCYYANQVGQIRVRVAAEAFLSVQMAHGGDSKRTVAVGIPSHLLTAVRGAVRRIPPLMKSDILEMTGAMTALCQDTVEGGGGHEFL